MRDAGWWSPAAFVPVGALLIAACSHARTVEEPSAEAEREEQAAAAAASPPIVVEQPDMLLRPGAGRKIQEALRQRGYLSQLEDDEALGELTTRAIERLQRESGLAATGFPDTDTLRVLGLDPERIYRKAMAAAGPDEP